MSTVLGVDVCLLQLPTIWDERMCLLGCVGIAGSSVFGRCVWGAEVQSLFGKQMRDRSLSIYINMLYIYGLHYDTLTN